MPNIVLQDETLQKRHPLDVPPIALWETAMMKFVVDPENLITCFEKYGYYNLSLVNKYY